MVKVWYSGLGGSSIAIHITATAPTAAAATITAADATMSARKVRERVVEKQDPIKEETAIRMRWRRAIIRGRGLDQDR
jgi:hypothetical protein